MNGVQCYELFGGIALKNHAFFSFFFLFKRHHLVTTLLIYIYIAVCMFAIFHLKKIMAYITMDCQHMDGKYMNFNGF